jgi:hypothetical protein
MAKEQIENRLTQMAGDFKTMVNGFFDPQNSSGPSWDSIVDARRAIDEHRNELIRAGVIQLGKSTDTKGGK